MPARRHNLRPRRTNTVALAISVLGILALVAGCADPDLDQVAAPATTPASTTSADAQVDGSVRPSRACEESPDVSPPLDSTDSTDTTDVTVDGKPRSAQVHLPGGIERSRPAPVVLSFHGLDGSAAVQQATDGFDGVADREGFVVIRPEGLDVGLNDRVTGTTGWDADGSQVDEAAFVTTVLDQVESKVCIDRARVFATGFSAGGNIAVVVACELQGRIAAVAPVGAAYQRSDCSDGPALPLIAFHGTDDLIVPVDGRDDAAGSIVAVLDAVEAQAVHNGCDPEPLMEAPTARDPQTSDPQTSDPQTSDPQTSDPQTSDPQTIGPNASVQQLRWSGCEAATELYLVPRNGHSWPGHPLPFDREVLSGIFTGGEGQPPNQLMAAIGLSPAAMTDNVLLTNSDVDATELIWEFFTDVAHPGR